MPNSSLVRAPDIFCIQLPAEAEGVRLAAFESAWGVTDEILCYWQGILIGELVQGRRERFVNLLPKLDARRGYAWPTVDAFALSLQDLLRQIPAAIWCEWDADQGPVESIDRLDDLIDRIRSVVAYCEGSRGSCPSFSYLPAAPNNSFKPNPLRGSA